MYGKFVRVYFKDGSVRNGFYENSSIPISCEAIKIADIQRMELFFQ